MNMKMDKVIRCWPIIVSVILAITALGGVGSVVAGNTKTNDKQDKTIERIMDMQREQATTNGRVEAQVKSTKEAVGKILDILLESKARREPR